MIPLRSRRDPAPTVHGPDDVVGRLADCHARIRRFLVDARALATGTGEPSRRRESARAVLRYFRVAMPLHEADEDASIAPRIEQRSVGLARALLARMDEHGAIDAAVDLLCADWACWAGEGDPGHVVDLAGHQRLLETLDAAMEVHLELEEREIFPAIDTLPASERRAIVLEMQERRR
ncbi:hemerythrin domain-containing protein [Sandaracinus amylolyticus]|uniref:Hemerythrin-like domain-containing protein n=1 Tax=Sandaracinus amylolyticus TaxID=927083 RepID=A0A0F6SI69_9BACT|nr:hemerythrin domain-containing protein [Sandaracinus amylolyticus]AKF11674.1 hypothetical protein DB32_008823 [Sandaracinus amylolyticus]